MKQAIHTAFAAALVALISTSQAAAEGYSTVDLGLQDTKPACMAKAERVMQRYKDTLGAHSVSTGTWTTFGWDLEPGDQDVVIMCTAPTSNANERRRAIMVVHGSGTESERYATRDVLKGYWNAD